MFQSKFELSSLKNKDKLKSAENNFLRNLKHRKYSETVMNEEKHQSQQPNYKIISIESNITIAKNKCNGLVKENKNINYQMALSH